MTGQVDWYTDDWRQLAQLVDTRIETTMLGSVPSAYEARRGKRLTEVVRLIFTHLASRELEYETSQPDFSAERRFRQPVRLPALVGEGRKGNCVELALVFASYCLVTGLRPVLLASQDHVAVAVWLGGEVSALDRGPSLRLPAEDHEFIAKGLLRTAEPDRAKEALLARVVAAPGDRAAVGTPFLVVEPTAFTITDGVGNRTFEDACAQGRAWLAAPGTSLQGLADVGFLLYQDGYRGQSWRPRVDRLGGSALRSLSEALAVLDGPVEPVPAEWDMAALRRLRHALAGRPVEDTAAQHAIWLAGSLLLVLDTAMFLRDWCPLLTVSQMRRAAAGVLAQVAPSDAGWVLDDRFADLDVLTSVALDHPAANGGGGAARALVEFVVQLAVDLDDGARAEAGPELMAKAGTRSSALQDERLCSWAERHVSYVTLNEIDQAVRRRRRSGPWRLVLSLDSPDGDWPSVVSAWIVDRDGRPLWDNARREASERRDSDAVAAAIGRILDWADRAEIEFDDIDVAVPANLLGRGSARMWRPEELAVDQMMLGQDYRVTVRWSRRLIGGRNLRAVWRRYKKIMALPAPERLHWRDETEPEPLRERLRAGAVPAVALGLANTTPGGHLAELLDLLLEQSPIVVWPDPDRVALPGEDWAAARTQLAECWNDEDPPRRLLAAYQQRRTVAPQPGPPLSLVRAVWEDMVWLTFCKRMNSPAPTAYRPAGRTPA